MFPQSDKTTPASLRALFAGAAVGLSVTDRSGVFVSANDAYQEITGYTEEELKRTDYQSITYPDDLPANLQLVTRLYTAQVSHAVYEKRYVTRTGDLRWVRNSVSSLLNSAGQITHVVALTEDISEWGNCKEKVERTESLLRRMVERTNDEKSLERRRIAMNLECNAFQLMGSFVPSLAGLKYSSVLSAEEKCVLSEVMALTDRFIYYIRTLGRLLSPLVPVAPGWRIALADYVERFAIQASMNVRPHISEEFDALSPAVQAATFGAVKCGLAGFAFGRNVGAISLRILPDGGNILVEVEGGASGKTWNHVECIDLRRLQLDLRAIGGSAKATLANGRQCFRASIPMRCKA